MQRLPPLLLSPRLRTLLAILNVIPLPGLGALVAGWRNPHTVLRRNGAIQMALFLAGAYPLVIPGVAALVWAGFDAWRMRAAPLRPMPPKPGQDAAPVKP